MKAKVENKKGKKVTQHIAVISSEVKLYGITEFIL